MQRREIHQHTDRAKQFQEEQEKTRADFEAKSRAHAESIASLRNGHVEAAKVSFSVHLCDFQWETAEFAPFMCEK